ncbi:MAG: ABC transporter permease [Planctomycetota bacterium]|jgi:ABC-type Fe3+ transport system permease subunit
MTEKSFLSVIVLIIALAVTGGPLVAFYLGAALEDPAELAEFPHEPITGWGTLGWTFLLSIMALLGAAALGVPAGIAIAGLRGRWRAIAVCMSLVMIAIPPFVFADALQNAANAFLWVVASPSPGETVPAFGGFATSAIVLALAFWPVVALAVAAALLGIPRQVRESAALSLNRTDAVRYVVFPFLLPFLVGTLLLVFLMAFVNHTVPTLYLVQDVLGHSVFFDYQLTLSMRIAAAGTLPQIVLVGAVCVLLWITFGKKGAGVPADGRRTRRLRSWPGITLAAFLITVLFWSVVFPLGYLLLRSFCWTEFVREFSRSLPAMGWSLLLGTLSAAIITVLGFLGGYYCEIERRRGWNAVTALALLAFAVPGIVPGLGLKTIAGYAGAWMDGVLAVLGVGIPFFIIALVIGRAGFRNADRGQIESARLSGLSRWRMVRHVILPMVYRPFVTAWLLIFAFALGEVTVVGLFIPPGMETLSRSLFQAMHYGSPGIISIRCLLLAAMTTVPILAVIVVWSFRSGRGSRYGTGLA